jgi:hypothetical protein
MPPEMYRLWAMGRWFTATLGIAAACVALTASPASAASQFGQTTGSAPCTAPQTLFQTSSPTGPYAAPAAGVITSWQYRSPMMSQIGRALELKVGRPAGGNTMTIVGESDRETPTIPLSDLSFPTRIPVEAGDILGLYVPDTDAPCSVGPSPGFGVHRILDNLDRPTGDTSTYTSVNQTQVNVAATLEPDADGDGFGDETQDQCPGVPVGEQPCDRVAPDTAITKKPKSKTKRKKAKFEFGGSDTRSVAGFQCSVDSAPFASCASPLTVKVKKGKHTFRVRAVDADGNVDATPAAVSWKVKKIKKQK